MAEPRKARVMFSSRSNSTVQLADGPATLRDLRIDLQQRLEAIELFGEPLFEVWINETSPPKQAATDAWEESLRQIRRADFVIALYNGDAGWAMEDEDVGICHAELLHALNTADHKVRLVHLPSARVRGARHVRFRDYVEQQHIDFGREVESRDDLWDVVGSALRDGLGGLLDGGFGVQAGFVDRSSLSWDLLDFSHRRAAMVAVLEESLRDRADATDVGDGVALRVWDRNVVFRCDAVPGAMSVAAARELVGQPFLDDHTLAGEIKASSATAGPVHLIACHKGVTEAQAMRLLGFPDATIVAAEFGVYVADDVQKIQLVLLKNCRNPDSTRLAVQRLFTWLERAGEGTRLAGRAESRLRIVAAIASEAPDN